VGFHSFITIIFISTLTQETKHKNDIRKQTTKTKQKTKTEQKTNKQTNKQKTQKMKCKSDDEYTSN